MNSVSNRTRLLGECLSFELGPGDLPTLRTALFEPGALRDLTAYAEEYRLLSILAQRLLDNVLVPPDPPGRPGPADVLQRYLASHRERRQMMKQQLHEIVATLNGIGIQPILLKGAHSLWQGQPEWRFLRDIDLLVPADSAHAAQRALGETGYRPDPEQPNRPHRHHLAPLYNEKLNGWVEIHRRGGNRYAERLVPTRDLVAASTISEDGALSVGLLEPTINIMHAFVHHHVGHSADARGTIDLKGLYEFSWAVHELTSDERRLLAERAAAHPRLAAILDFWLAAANRLFSLPVEDPLAIAPDAAARVEWVFGDDRRSVWKYPGYGPEIRMACANERLRRVNGGSGIIGRQVLRWNVIASMLPAIKR